MVAATGDPGTLRRLLKLDHLLQTAWRCDDYSVKLRIPRAIFVAELVVKGDEYRDRSRFDLGGCLDYRREFSEWHFGCYLSN